MTWLVRLRTRAIGKSGQLTLKAGKLIDQLSKILAYRYGSLPRGAAQASQATREFRSPNIMRITDFSFFNRLRYLASLERRPVVL
jgi:hypothetical protein